MLKKGEEVRILISWEYGFKLFNLFKSFSELRKGLCI